MEHMPQPGQPETLAPGIQRVLAPNPGPMTYWGTNTYLVGDRDLAVIDPGPADAAHRAALQAAIAGRPVVAVVVTHAHRDHADLAAGLASDLGAPVAAFGPLEAGRSPVMARLALSGLLGGGEGVAPGFAPDVTLPDGAVLGGQDWTLEALHMPGHFGNHLCLRMGRFGFSGDLAMGWASTLISPPDGDLAQFRASCTRLRDLGLDRLLPGHGAPIEDPAARLDWLLAHRAERGAQVQAALATGPATATDLAARIYHDTPPGLLPAAARNVLAHLIDLAEQDQAIAPEPLSADGLFRPADP